MIKGIFDSHAHLTDEDFDPDRDQVISHLKEGGVEIVINPGIDPKTSQEAIDLAKKHPGIYAMVGTHPHEAEDFKEEDYDLYKKMAQEEKVVAVGEIGLDYYYDHSPRDLQKKVFIRQLELAQDLSLPVAIHTRDAIEDTYNILESFPQVKGVLHCYSGSAEMAERFLKLGYYISLAGPVTFKNAKTPKEVAACVPLNRLLIETDSPYLTPHPYRGKRNDPTKTRYVAEEIAKIRQMDIQDLVDQTRENAKRLFGL